MQLLGRVVGVGATGVYGLPTQSDIGLWIFEMGLLCHSAIKHLNVNAFRLSELWTPFVTDACDKNCK
jgi:hypothetical protein